MTALLIDTNAFLGLTGVGDSANHRLVLQRIMEGAERLCLSAVSFFEVNQKVRIGKLNTLSYDANTISKVEKRGIELLSLTPLLMAQAAALNWTHKGRAHRDPFDRMIAATALAENLTVLSSDAAFDAVQVERIWI